MPIVERGGKVSRGPLLDDCRRHVQIGHPEGKKGRLLISGVSGRKGKKKGGGDLVAPSSSALLL